MNPMVRRVMVASYIHGCVGGILRATCQRGKSNFADEIVHIRGDDLRIHLPSALRILYNLS
jgi:hypothetical protein